MSCVCDLEIASKAFDLHLIETIIFFFCFSNVFFFSVLDPFDAMQVCVSKCPTKDLMTKREVREFSLNTKSKLCRYDIPVEDYEKQEFRKEGPCPELPIFARSSIIFACLYSMIWVSLPNYLQRDVCDFNFIFSIWLEKMHSNNQL